MSAFGYDVFGHNCTLSFNSSESQKVVFNAAEEAAWDYKGLDVVMIVPNPDGEGVVTIVSNYTTDGALIDQTETIFDGTDIQDSVNKALDSIDGYYRLMNFPEDSGITNSPGKAEGCVEEGGVWHEDRGWCEYPKQQVECDALMKIIGCGWLWKRLKQGRPGNNNPDALLVWVGSDAFNDAICCTTLNS